MATGVVKWFNEGKGFGFIKPDDGGSDLFAHYSGIKSKGFRTLKENQRVEYQVQQGQKGPQAVEIDVHRLTLRRGVDHGRTPCRAGPAIGPRGRRS